MKDTWLVKALPYTVEAANEVNGTRGRQSGKQVRQGRRLQAEASWYRDMRCDSGRHFIWQDEIKSTSLPGKTFLPYPPSHNETNYVWHYNLLSFRFITHRQLSTMNQQQNCRSWAVPFLPAFKALFHNIAIPRIWDHICVASWQRWRLQSSSLRGSEQVLWCL